MRYLFFILIPIFLITPIFACIDGEEVELWDECYNINSTFSLMLENSGLTGIYSINWNAKEYTSGVYFVKLASKDFIATKKLF